MAESDTVSFGAWLASNSSSIALAALSGGAGFALKNWLSRAYPVLTLSGASTTTLISGTIPEPSKFVEALALCDCMPHAATGPVPNVLAVQLRDMANQRLSAPGGDDTEFGRCIQLLHSASSDATRREAVLALLTSQVVSDYLSLAYLRQHANLPAATPIARTDAPLGVELLADRNGCYAIVFDEFRVRVGAGLHREVWRKARIQRLIDAISGLDTEYLCAALMQIRKWAVGDIAHVREFARAAQEAVDSVTVVSVAMSVVNLGPSPVAVMPTAEIEVLMPNTKAWIGIAADLVQEVSRQSGEADPPQLQAVQGPLLVPPSGAVSFAANLSADPAAAQRVAQVRAQLGTDGARVRVRLMLRRFGFGIGFPRWIRSESVPFA